MTYRRDIDAALAALEQAAYAVDGADAPALLGELERVKGIVLARLVATSGGAPDAPKSADPATPTILGVQAAARFLQVSPTTLRRLVTRGAIPHVPVGRRLLFRRATLEQFAADRERFGDERS